MKLKLKDLQNISHSLEASKEIQTFKLLAAKILMRSSRISGIVLNKIKYPPTSLDPF